MLPYLQIRISILDCLEASLSLPLLLLLGFFLFFFFFFFFSFFFFIFNSLLFSLSF